MRGRRRTGGGEDWFPTLANPGDKKQRLRENAATRAPPGKYLF
jgi:hypothetical protein